MRRVERRGVRVTGEYQANERRIDGNQATASRCRDVESDTELLERCRQHDQDAWAELVARYERLVFSIPLRSGLSREDSADVTQLTFAALVETIDNVEKAESLGSWLMTVARRTTWRIRNSSDREMAGDDVGADLFVDATDADLAQTLAVHGALAKIGRTCRDLLRALFADEEPSYVEVARRVGRPIGSIGPMRARCLNTLRDALETN